MFTTRTRCTGTMLFDSFTCFALTIPFIFHSSPCHSCYSDFDVEQKKKKLLWLFHCFDRQKLCNARYLLSSKCKMFKEAPSSQKSLLQHSKKKTRPKWILIRMASGSLRICQYLFTDSLRKWFNGAGKWEARFFVCRAKLCVCKIIRHILVCSSNNYYIDYEWTGLQVCRWTHPEPSSSRLFFNFFGPTKSKQIVLQPFEMYYFKGAEFETELHTNQLR